ncbi:Rieske 2Fe-2S domain-containing protein [Celeribacter persicus]|uniref:Phenylpropionate dioxygenase-like ring-hydroxylating dioxygenase large terminal subunit n=1 Tax=Celeribacter persicus TaxID=1651082 RepID=A0A2T5HUM1_9RHOB|nr:Rieske 2Fe-2S domain-containing protein [Celeribacter persicus]PTQ75293.1 phenylpropionate dioxygenase-like ring-hydroxylating dioxygenase large terminal subunit [Celeribacter persicus]
MLSTKDNQDLSLIGPGTLMGNFMRQFWIPACASRELEPDAAPMRLMLMGEKLVAFRDSEGRVGVLDHLCPHRCASLFFGRNEKSGLRCAYHGWKFDVEGNCLEMPNVPDKFDFSPKVKAKAYPVRERNGLVYVFMGDPASIPPLPEIDALMLPENEVDIFLMQRECNWLQSAEGDIDTSHFGFLHLGLVDDEDVDHDNIHAASVLDRAPEYFCKDAQWGTTYCAFRPAPQDDMTHYRFSHFQFPFFTLFPDGTFEDNMVVTCNVPMDDTHTMVVVVTYKKREEALRTRKDGSAIPGLEIDAAGTGVPMIPNDAGWFGRFRGERRASNDYLIDRAAQKSDNWSGIETVVGQDQAMVESMGALVPREFEHMAPSDIMVARTRRRLLKAARAYAEKGVLPEVQTDVALSHNLRSGTFLAPKNLDWVAAYKEKVAEMQKV